MIVADAYQVQDAATGRFLTYDIVEPGEGLTPVKWGYIWVDDPCRADAHCGAYVDRLMEERWRLTRNLDGADLAKVPAPACGCCGKIERGLVGQRYQIVLKRAIVRGVVHWRCAKHVGRNPCCIAGCGKTFALKGDKDGRGAEDYNWRIMCGKCWRQAPKWMRDRVARYRKLARRRQWPDQLARIHSMAWDACHRAIIRRRTADIGEVVEASGPPPAQLLAELQSLGL